MTLRELINKSSYKSVFNILYRDYYKNRDDEEVSYIDLAYLRAWNEFIKKDLNFYFAKEIMDVIDVAIPGLNGKKKRTTRKTNSKVKKVS